MTIFREAYGIYLVSYRNVFATGWHGSTHVQYTIDDTLHLLYYPNSSYTDYYKSHTNVTNFNPGSVSINLVNKTFISSSDPHTNQSIRIYGMN